MVNDFDEKVKTYMEDEVYAINYKKVVVMPCELGKTLQMHKGVDSFWLRAMINHPNISGFISEKDRVILSYLKNIECHLH